MRFKAALKELINPGNIPNDVGEREKSRGELAEKQHEMRNREDKLIERYYDIEGGLGRS